MIKNMNRRIKKKITLLGLNMNYKLFIYMRLITTIMLFIFLLLFVEYSYFIAPIASIIYYIFSEYIILDLGLNRREESLENDALEFFPIFLLALKSGRNIKNAIKLCTNNVDNELSKEFRRVLRNIDLGKSLDESLSMLENRIPSQIINNIIVSIIEANRLGNNLNDTINIQLAYIKERQKKSILTKYKSIPLKLAIISIVFVSITIILLMLFSYYL